MCTLPRGRPLAGPQTGLSPARVLLMHASVLGNDAGSLCRGPPHHCCVREAATERGNSPDAATSHVFRLPKETHDEQATVRTGRCDSKDGLYLAAVCALLIGYQRQAQPVNWGTWKDNHQCEGGDWQYVAFCEDEEFQQDQEACEESAGCGQTPMDNADCVEEDEMKCREGTQTEYKLWDKCKYDTGEDPELPGDDSCSCDPSNRHQITFLDMPVCESVPM